MRFLQVLCIMLLAALLSAAFLACSKEKDAVVSITGKENPAPGPVPANATPDIKGQWTGRLFGIDKSNPYQMAFSIKGNGVFEVLDIDKKHIGTGQWIIKGNKFEASCTVAAQVKSYYFKGEVNPSFDQVGGIWGYDDKGSKEGTWDMSR